MQYLGKINNIKISHKVKFQKSTAQLISKCNSLLNKNINNRIPSKNQKVKYLKASLKSKKKEARNKSKVNLRKF